MIHGCRPLEGKSRVKSGPENLFCHGWKAVCLESVLFPKHVTPQRFVCTILGVWLGTSTTWEQRADQVWNAMELQGCGL
jgi:hypothetical protein